MVMNYNISIIIPHKNIPKLLERCLNSIPEREDIQVLIVDDNSDKKYKNNFPGLTRENTKVFFSEKSLTAGGARNIGLENAQGKFVMFADADDFFHPCFYKTIKTFFDKDFDLVYFGMNSVFSDTMLPANRASGIIPLLKKASKKDEESINIIRYKFLYPSCKLIKRSLIEKESIKFDEVPASNDTMFGVKVATFAKNIHFNTSIIYCLTYRENSLVTSYTYKTLKSRLLVSFDLYYFLKAIQKEKYAQSSVEHWLQIRHANYFLFIKDFFILLKHYSFCFVLKSFIIKLKGI